MKSLILVMIDKYFSLLFRLEKIAEKIVLAAMLLILISGPFLFCAVACAAIAAIRRQAG